jgi:amidase
MLFAAVVVVATTWATRASAGGGIADVEERSIDALQADLTAGRTTSEALVNAYLARIRRIDRAGPRLRAILAINPHALATARALDRERRAGQVRGPLHGIPIVIKDNIESKDPLPTTAGSLALVANVTGRDAPLVAALREAGAIILGKTNLSEWANFRSDHSISGWSAVGGLTRNPYVLDRSACGSSSGTGAGVAASLAAAGVGTETDGSIMCPSSVNGLVGLKPSAGLVPQEYIVPISHTQDTAGPMGRSVRDVALLMNAMASVPGFTTNAPLRSMSTNRIIPNQTTDVPNPERRIAGGVHMLPGDFTSGLKTDALQGKRLGVVRYDDGSMPGVDEVFERALRVLRAAGATLVEVKIPIDPRLAAAEELVLQTEFKVGIDDYLANTPTAVKTRTLQALIDFNAKTPAEMRWFGQETFVKAQATRGLADPDYQAALQLQSRLAGTEGLMRAILANGKLAALVTPTTGPAWTIDTVNGDHYGHSFTSMPAIAGYPHLTVPMGLVRGLPVGLSFVSLPNTDAALLALGFAYETASHARTAPKYLPTIDVIDR